MQQGGEERRHLAAPTRKEAQSSLERGRNVLPLGKPPCPLGTVCLPASAQGLGDGMYNGFDTNVRDCFYLLIYKEYIDE